MFHVDVDLTKEEEVQYDALLVQMDRALHRIVEYLAAKSGFMDVSSLPRKKVESLLTEANSLAEAFDQVHTDENEPVDESDEADDPDDLNDDYCEDASDFDDDDDPDLVRWDPDSAADKLANLDRDLLQLLAGHQTDLTRIRVLVGGALKRRYDERNKLARGDFGPLD